MGHSGILIQGKMQQTLEAPMTREVLWTAVKQGALNKSPSEEGICHKSYIAYWERVKYGLLQIYNSVRLRGSLDIFERTEIIV
jgi:hypothetical protein